MTTKKKKKKQLHEQIMSSLRKLWLWSDNYAVAKSRAKVKGVAGGYLCESCKTLTTEPDVHHLRGVGRVPGSKFANGTETWDGVIERLFCDSSMLAVICKPCHAQLTAQERKKGFI